MLFYCNSTYHLAADSNFSVKWFEKAYPRAVDNSLHSAHQNQPSRSNRRCHNPAGQWIDSSSPVHQSSGRSRSIPTHRSKGSMLNWHTEAAASSPLARCQGRTSDSPSRSHSVVTDQDSTQRTGPRSFRRARREGILRLLGGTGGPASQLEPPRTWGIEMMQSDGELKRGKQRQQGQEERNRAERAEGDMERPWGGVWRIG